MSRLNSFLCLVLFSLICYVPSSAQMALTELNINNTKLRFIPNQNQFHDKVEYLCKLGAMDRVYLEKDGFTYVFHEHEDFHDGHAENECVHDHDEGIKAHAYKVHFEGASPTSPIGGEKMKHNQNYFIGSDESKWASNVPVYQLAEYKELYSGINLKSYSKNGYFKYDFIVEPDADPSKIKLRYEGVDQIRLHDNELIIPAAGKIIRELKPYAYQIVDGKQIEVRCEYKLDGNFVSYYFPDSYNKSKQLIIDPTVVGSTLTGSPTEGGFGHTGAFDKEGNMYLGGISFGSDYPVTLGAFQTSFAGGNQDIAVSKYNQDGTELIYATYLGSTLRDWAHSIIVDNNQQLCVLGTTVGNNYPVTTSAFQRSFGGDTDIVISRLSKDGSQLIGSTFMGGSDFDGQNQSNLNTNYGEEYRGEINLDAYGNIFIASCSSSSDFPTTDNAFQAQHNSSQDGIIFKMNTDLSVLFWSTYLGGSDNDVVSSLRIDDQGEIYVTGTAGDEDFPTTAGLIQSEWPGGQESAFISVLSSNGQNLLRSTFWGTTTIDHSYFLDLDEENNVHIFGQTTGQMLITPDTYFYTENSNQFISGFTNDLTEVVYSTTIGTGSVGTNFAFVPVAFMVDKCNGIYFSGYYAKAGLPVTSDAIYQASSDPDGIFYLGVLSPNAQSLKFGSYFADASHVDGGTSRFDKAGIVYQAVCSCMWSGELDTTPGAYAESQTAGCNAGIFKVDFEIETVTADIVVEPSGSGCAPYEVDFKYAGKDGVNFFWDFDGIATTNLQNPSFTFTDPGSYEVMLVAQNLNTCNLVDTTYITIDVLGGIGKMENKKLCENSEYTFLDASIIDATYEWSDGSTGPTLQVSDPGVYWVDISLTECATRDSFVVELQTSDFTLGPDITTCSDNAYQLNAADPNILSYQWNIGLTTSAIDIEETGEYIITVTDSEGCYYIDTIDVVIFETIDINFSPDTTVCPGQTLLLDPNLGNINYEWQDGSTASSFEVTEPGTYSLSAQSGTCQDESEIEVSFSELELELGDDQAFCGETEFLIPGIENLSQNSQPDTYEWSEGSSSDELTVIESGEYWLEVTDIHGCVASDNIEVLLEPYPDPALPNLDLCANDSLQIDISEIGSEFMWQDGSSEAIIDINEAGEYSVHIIEKHCEFRDTFSVNFFDITTITLDADHIDCHDDCSGAIQSTASANIAEYAWSNGSFNSEITDLCAGEYILDFTDENGCIFRESIVIAEEDPLEIDISTSAHDCNGETIGVLEINGAVGGVMPYEYLIDGIPHTDGLLINELEPGPHNFIVTDANNCSWSEQFQINQAPPNIIDAGEDQIIQVGTATYIEGTVSNPDDLIFSWFPPEELNCDDCLTTTARPLDSIEYILTATNILTGCVMMDSVFIEVREKESIFIPNIFTPGGDEENSHFTVFSKSVRLDVLKLRIYDRWGSLIYESENFDTNKPIQGWDGTFQGEKVLPGVYVYMAEVLFYNGEEKVFTGDITVME